MNAPQTWYIVKLPAGHCEIVSREKSLENDLAVQERWGPFTQNEAIARRVGLIRAGKCQPQ